MDCSITLSSWAHFLDKAQDSNLTTLGCIPFAFRGHSDVDWKLRPTFLRDLPKNFWDVPTDRQSFCALDLERRLQSEFQESAHLHLPQSVFATTTDGIGWLSLMQHHGASTRLLDWSASIFVAAYFAVHGNPDKDGVIWITHIHSVDKWMKNEYGDNAVPEEEDEIQKTFFEEKAPDNLSFVTKSYKNDRMVAQQGLFSVCRNILGDHEKILENVCSEKSKTMRFGKLIIRSEDKPYFARQLRSMNLSANTLFPGIDGLGKSVAESLRLAFPPITPKLTSYLAETSQ